MSIIHKLKDAFMPVSRRMLKRELARVEGLLEGHSLILNSLKIKTSMVDSIWQIEDVLFFVPNYPMDFIQYLIVNDNQFYESDILTDLAQFIPSQATICDIGANIGNHTLYWLKRANAKFVYCFEPHPNTFKILEKNIELNRLRDKTKCLNVALSDDQNKLSSSFFNQHDLGRNAYQLDQSGMITAHKLDDVGIKSKVDFIKIDVEGMELAVLNGAKRILNEDRPLVLVEAFGENYQKVTDLLSGFGYKKIKSYPHSNYLYAV